MLSFGEKGRSHAEKLKKAFMLDREDEIIARKENKKSSSQTFFLEISIIGLRSGCRKEVFPYRHVDIGEAVLVDVAHFLRLGFLGNQDDLALICQEFAISFASLLVVHPSAISAVKIEQFGRNLQSSRNTTPPSCLVMTQCFPLMFMSLKTTPFSFKRPIERLGSAEHPDSGGRPNATIAQVNDQIQPPAAGKPPKLNH